MLPNCKGERIIGMMKILIVSQYFWPEQFKVNDVAFDFAQSGHEVTVLTAKPNYPEGKFFKGYGMFSKKEEYIKGVRIIRTPIFPRKNGKPIFLFLNYLSFIFFSYFTATFRIKGEYDVIFAHLTSPITAALPAIRLKKRYKIPLVLWVLDLWPESVEATTNIKSKFLYRYLNKLVSYIYSKADVILASSRFFIDSIREKIKDKPIDILYFPNWAEDIFTKRGSKYKDLPTFPEGFNIMFAGNIGDAQDFESILKASEMVQNERINWLIIGEGRKYDWLKSEISAKNISNVKLYGRHPLEAMPAFFEKADAMLVSLKDEPIFRLTVPAKIQAYMASGKIILGMINGESSDLINESQSGYSVSAGDFRSLASKAVDLKNMPTSELEAMEENSRNYFEENFNKKRLLTKLETLFTQLHSKKDEKGEL